MAELFTATHRLISSAVVIRRATHPRHRSAPAYDRTAYRRRHKAADF